MVHDYSTLFSSEVMCRGFIIAHKNDDTIEYFPSKEEYEKLFAWDTDGPLLITEMMVSEGRIVYPTGESHTFENVYTPFLESITKLTIDRGIIPIHYSVLNCYIGKDTRFDEMLNRNKLINSYYNNQIDVIAQCYMSSTTSLDVFEYAFMDFMVDALNVHDSYIHNVPCAILNFMIENNSGYDIIDDYIKIIHKSVTGI